MNLNFTIRDTKQKDPASYKSLYIKNSLLKEVNKIANANHTSFNNIVISMIEHCLNDNNVKNK
jgi:hypothetical protein